MARTSKRMAEEKIDRLLAEGRGRGEGADWKPWIEVFDFSSMGSCQSHVQPQIRQDRAPNVRRRTKHLLRT
jgi:hypothetical protein